jgi:hypothetical protein
MHITTKDEFNTNTHYLEPAPVKRIPELPCGVPVSYPCRTRVPVATRGEAKKTKVCTRIPASYPCRTRGYPRRSEKKPKSVPVYPCRIRGYPSGYKFATRRFHLLSECDIICYLLWFYFFFIFIILIFIKINPFTLICEIFSQIWLETNFTQFF